LSGVRVHYNSPAPATLGALAYAQGNTIHLGRGQEKHLPHEGWHVVQQMQGRVRPTVQYKRVAMNTDNALEKEADVMGEKALRGSIGRASLVQMEVTGDGIVQRAPAGPPDPKKAKPPTREEVDEQDRLWLTDKNGKRWYMRDNGNVRWWQPVRKKKGVGGYSVYMRTPDVPLTLQDIASAKNTMDAYEDDVSWGVFEEGPVVDVVAQANPKTRDQQGTVMAKHFGQAALLAANCNNKYYLGASEYAGEEDWEWLHMQGHSLGGQESAANLVAGSHGANTEMAAIESAVGRFMGSKSIRLAVTPSLEIATRLGKPSLKARLIDYKVWVNGTLVIERRIDASRGRMPKVEYDSLETNAVHKIQFESPVGKPIEFVQGETLFQSSSADELEQLRKSQYKQGFDHEAIKDARRQSYLEGVKERRASAISAARAKAFNKA
jgi:hypothetical protein